MYRYADEPERQTRSRNRFLPPHWPKYMIIARPHQKLSFVGLSDWVSHVIGNKIFF